MRKLLPIAAALSLTAGLSAQTVVINEVDSDTDPQTLEFVELYDGGVGNTDLTGKVLVLFNGNGDVSYEAFDLTGQSTDANGFFVIGDISVANLDLSWGSKDIQNGPDAVALYTGTSASFPNGTAATATNLLDAVVYNAGGGTDAALAAILTPGFGTVNEDANSNENLESIARVPDGGTPRDTSTYLAGAPTPGATNGVPNILTLGLSASTISESDDGTNAITATVTRSDTSGGDLVVSIVLNDPSEASAAFDVTITGTDPSAQFTIFAKDDTYPDGTQTVEVSVSAAGATGDSQTFDVTDDVTDAYSLVINELHIVPDASTGDLNGDTVVTNDDEFVEIVNVGVTQVDLTGFTLRDRFSQTHQFREGTLLDPGCALLVFSGQGNLTLGTQSGVFGTAEVQVASVGETLRLTNSGDTVSIRNSADEEVYKVTYGDFTGLEANGSLALQTDKDATSGYAQHGLIAGAVGTLSPGFFLDGSTPFCNVTQSLTVTLTPDTVAEDAGAGASTARVSIPSDLLFDLKVTIAGDDPSEAVPAGTPPIVGTITAGQTFVDFPIDAVDDAQVEGADQIVTITGIASGYLNGTGTLTVTDVGDVPTFTDLVINEIDADQPGTDTEEFIELYNLTGTAAALDGLVVVLFNGFSSGTGEVSYEAIDLTGQTIPANGYFVLGNAAVSNVDLVFSDSSLQNGADAVALYVGSAADFPNGTVASTVTNTLVDAVVYGTNDGDATTLLGVFGGTQQNEGPSNNTTSVSRNPDGSGTFAAQDPTPGTSNTATVPEYAPATITGISIDSGLTTVTLTFVGVPDYPYSLFAGSDLETFNIPIVPSAGSTTPDGAGDGSLEFPYGAGNFFFLLDEASE